MSAPTAPVVRRMSLYGTPCGVCGLPAHAMDVAGSWTRTWHAKATWSTVARFCDVGSAPTGVRP